MSDLTVVAIGASAGGVQSVKDLVAMLPPHFPAAVLVVIHFPPTGISVLADILNRAGPLPAVEAVDGERLKPGRIYTGVPDRHLMVEDGVIRLSRGPRENHCRPAIDALFRSVAHAIGPRSIGVVLSGTLNDGTAGLIEIKKLGGCAVVQDPKTALFREMPRSAIQAVSVDYVLPLHDMARVLEQIVQELDSPEHDRVSHVASTAMEGTVMTPDHKSADDRVIAAILKSR